jgi:uncharacterized protein
VRFWDTSALVPLIVQQTRSSEAIAWVAEDAGIVAWTLTQTEVLSAIRRLTREGGLTARAATEAERVTLDLMIRSQVVADIEPVKARAARLLRTHPLRAGDALQLAAALAWANDRPDRQILHTFDVRLGQAAEREGFRVIPDA